MSSAVTMRSTTPVEAGLAASGLGFERPVPEGGYRWWYVDGFSDCGQFGITLIAFIGSVFSPYYYRARHRGRGQAVNHVSLNVILYGSRNTRWCMTERSDKELQQSPHRLDIGPSTLRASDCGLEIDIQERATPFGQRVVGRVSLSFERATDQCFELDGVGEHWWWPIAPIAQIDVAMARPELRWRGAAYVDSNYGVRPIETGFESWNWCRGHDAEGDCQIHYDAQLSGGGEKRLSLSVDRSGVVARSNERETRPATCCPNGVARSSISISNPESEARKALGPISSRCGDCRNAVSPRSVMHHRDLPGPYKITLRLT